MSFGVRVLLSHSVCSDKAANTCQGAHENAKLLMAIATKMQVRKKEAVMLLFTKKRKIQQQSLPSGVCQLVGVMFSFITKEL